MAVTDIAGAGRKVVEGLLADATTGLNPLLKAAMVDARLQPEWQPIDFERPGKNFFRMQLTDATLDSLPAGGSSGFLVLCLFVTGFKNTVMQKPFKFSGPTSVVIDLWASWSKNRLADTESFMDVFDAVMVEIFNRREAQAAFSTNAVYKANLTGRRGIPTTKGEQWRQQMRYEIPIDVNREF